MSERVRKRRDFIQNITIALLTVSAVMLFVRTQVHNLGTDSALGLLSAAETSVSPAAPSQSGDMLSAPVRVAVTGPYGRYGSVTLTTADESFEPLRSLLEQALGSARNHVSGSRQDFLDILSGTSVYYDFLSPLPLSMLAELARTSGDDATSVRYLAIAGEGERVSLYLWDGGERSLRCETALSPTDLEGTVGQYELGSAFFAFESTDENARLAAPCSLFLAEEPSLPNLTVSIPLSDTDHLLSGLGFNPNTQNRYPGSGGSEVIVDGERNLRIYADGTVTYRSGGDSALSIPVGEEPLTLPEAAAGAGALLNSLLSPTIGEAGLYLERVQQSGSSVTLRFGYQMDGVPIRFSDGQSAAQITLTGAAISSINLRVRQYTADGTAALLLPLRQALAIAAGHPGGELFIGYADSGAGTAAAKWLTD